MKRLKRKSHQIVSLFLAFLMVFGCFSAWPSTVNAFETDYEIYPKPHLMDYQNGDFIIHQDVNLVYETGIDDDTKNRMNEVLAIKQINATVSNQIDETKTNILVGIKNSGEYVDLYGKENLSVSTSGLFEKTDSYQLVVKDGVIAIIGNGTDSAFYGITTLYHIFKQMDSYTIRNFVMEDYADVASRGFIEGYYGNPWSTEDRINLMKWGGYYKLNSYFYAPKDDPKHNSAWRELYTDEEIETKIKPLAKAGNESKCRFVFALHPYMNSAINYSSEASYQADLKVMQAKFTQVIEAGVRQIAILADDAASVGGANYIKTLTDMTAWIKEMQKTYPDLKLTLPFVTVEYGDYGEDYYSDFPENIQIVMTGGRIWGEVSTNFTDTFTNNVGRGPYLWINWPCTDNSKQHLIMGGYDTFLHPNVDPSTIQGIVLNPMQQSEPSKVAIFGNACYSWNIWDAKEEADQAWYDSFKYVDHNSAIETPASNALRELSKHMINQNMDSRVTALQESIDLKDKLNNFKDILSSNGTVSEEMIKELKDEFTLLQNAAITYRNQAGDSNIKDQIVYWLDCYDETTAAALAYLDAIEADMNGDTSGILSNYSIGQKNFADSKTHKFFYVDHYEYAEVGVQHIVPFIKAMDSYLSGKVAAIADPNVVIKSYISNRFTNPNSGDLEDVLDNNDSTYVQFTSPNFILKDDYFGVSFSKGISIDSVRIAMGGGKNHFYNSKLQYTTDGTNWQDVSEDVYNVPKNSETPIEVTDLKLTDVKGIRLYSISDNGDDSWLLIKSFDINYATVQEEEESNINYSVIKTDGYGIYSGSEADLHDGNDDSFVWYDPDRVTNRDENPDSAIVGDYIGYDFGKALTLASTHIVVGNSGGDKFVNYCVETSLDGSNWSLVPGYENYTGETSGKDVLDIDLKGIQARYIRIRNLTLQPTWVKFSEFTVKEVKSGDSKHVFSNIKTDILSNVNETKDVASLTSGSVTLATNEYIGLKLDNIKEISKITVASSNKQLTLQISRNGVIWQNVDAKSAIGDACYVRLINLTDAPITTDINEFVVVSNEIYPASLYSCDVTIESSWGDTRNNGYAFDGDISTVNKIGGNPLKGQSIIYDLGQSVNFNSLRTYVSDSQVDYVRDALIQVSDDLENWQTAFEIGDGITDTDRTSPVRDSNVYQNIDSNYPNVRYEGNDNLDLTGRYIRVLFTADFPNRAAAINEFVINGGAYLPVENNKDYVGAIEEKGHQPSYMNDGNLSTTYKAATKNDEMTYRFSKVDDIKSFRIVQSGSVNNTSVKVRLYDDSTKQETLVVVGSLNQAINEFIVPSGKILTEVTISWQDEIPEIAEIITLNSVVAVDKSELIAKVDELKNVDTSNKTSSSAQKFTNALDIAKDAIINEYVSNESVISALGALVTSYNGMVDKYDVSDLQALVDNAISNDDGLYSLSSYRVYNDALSAAKLALTNKDNLNNEKGNAVYNDLLNAQNALDYSMINHELAIVAMEKVTLVNESDYTTNSYKAMSDAKGQLEKLINEDLTDSRVNPKVLKEATGLFNDAYNALVDVTTLKSVIDEFNGLDEAMYTSSSYKAYKDVIDSAKKLLVNGTEETINTIIEDATKAKGELKFTSSVALSDAIDAANKIDTTNYSKVTVDNLNTIVNDAKANQNISDAKNKEYVQKINDAINALVNIKAINDKLAQINSIDLTKYTQSSIDKLNAVISSVTTSKDALTKETEVNNLVNELNNAVSNLKLVSDEINDYVQQIELLDSKLYQDASYKTYLDAYNALKALGDDVSEMAFIKAKQAYETALSNLVYRSGDYSSVEAAKDKVPSDLSAYTAESVAKLNEALNNVVYGLSILDQDKIDLSAKAINDAIASLQKAVVVVPSIDSNKTGDNQMIIPFITGAMIAVAGLWIYRKKED